MKLKTIGFIGLGLIGGSIARRIKQVHPDTVIMAYMRTRSTLEEAKADGIVDIILDGVDETLRTCDMIILCTPVSFNESYLKAIRLQWRGPGTLGGRCAGHSGKSGSGGV